jgi:hypothetical protein
MFRKLNIRIVLLVFLSLWLTSLTIGIFAYLYAKNTMTKQFHSVFDSYFKSSGDNLAHDLNYTVEMFRMIGTHPQVRKALDNPEYDSRLPHQLDSLILNSTLRIQGMTLYTVNGLTYTTSLTSNPPALAHLASLPKFAQWKAASTDEPLWIWRGPADVHDFYNGKYGNSGVLTLSIKLLSASSAPLGYTVVDLDPEYLFRFFQTKNALLQGVGVGITNADGQLLADSRTAPSSGIHSAFSVLQQIQNSEDSLIVVIPESALSEPLRVLRKFLILATVSFALFSIAISLFLRRLIVKPLSNLYLKMRGFKTRHS